MKLCPKSPWWLISTSEPRIIIPTRCGSYKCDVCRPAKVAQRLRVTTWGASKADAIRLLTLTKVPEDWQHARGQIRDFVRRIRKAYDIQFAWAIEANPKGTGSHAHAITHGEYIPKDRLREMWGGRFIDIRRVEGGANDYLTKCAQVCGYTGKSVEVHLARNGGRAIHLTRGYLHGKTSREVLKLMSTGKEWRLRLATREEMESYGVGLDKDAGQDTIKPR